MIWDVYGIYFNDNGDDDDDYRWCWNPNICIQSPPQNWWYECFPASWTHCNICFNQPDFALRSALHYSIPFLLSHQIWCNICLIFPLLLLIRPTFNVISSGLAQFLYYFFFLLVNHLLFAFSDTELNTQKWWANGATVLLVLETKQTTNNQIKFYRKTCLMKIAVDLFILVLIWQCVSGWLKCFFSSSTIHKIEFPTYV